MRDRAALVLATWFGCGYFPKGPGTAGSLGALLVAYPLLTWAHWRAVDLALLAAAVLPIAIWASTATARITARKDPQIVVIDEVIGQWLALAGAASLNWKSWLGALLLFRLFDIWKPPPVRQLESLPSGTGIVMDDAMAGIYAALVLFAAGCFNLY
ncbi:MAG: phosphatidylglycerophosphatase A [Bryobacteraceae bacterium]